MKRLILTATLVLLPCLNAPAQPYTFHIVGGGRWDILGSQFYPPPGNAEILSTYFSTAHTGLPWCSTDAGAAMLWSAGFSIFQFDDFDCAWLPSDQPLPRGTGFFHKSPKAGGFDIVFPDFGNWDAATLAPGVWYLRSTPHVVLPVANYQNLVGSPTTTPVPNPQTFVWTWNAANGLTGDWDYVYRYRNGSWQKMQYPTFTVIPAPPGPQIPLGRGAFLGYGMQGAALQAPVQVAPDPCPPFVNLTLTFAGPLDPFTAAIPANYQILRAVPSACAVATTSPYLGGQVMSATPQWTVNGVAPPSVTTVVLRVKLYTQSCNNYFVRPTVNLKGLGGLAATGMEQFIPFCTGSPANDHPADALVAPYVLSSPATVSGSLTCADATPSSIASPFPPMASGKDVWYSFTPPTPGSVTIDTCTIPASTCISDTVLAAYQGYPGALYPIPGPWFDDNSCSPLSKLTFQAKPCTTYYIRVSGKNYISTPLHGDFVLNLAFTPNPAVPNDICTAPQSVSPNGSTAFNNVFATTTAGLTTPIVNDVWFRFMAPPGGGLATVSVLPTAATFNAQAAVYANCSSLSSPPISSPASGSSVTVSTVGSTYYYICVGGLSAGPTGCGFLHVSYPDLPPCTIGGTFGNCISPFVKSYTILGSGTAATWSWSLTAPAPCNLNYQGTATTTAGMSAYDIATAFRDSINNPSPICPPSPLLQAFAYNVSITPQKATLKICFPNPCNAANVVLKVGPQGNPNCWVDLPVLAANFSPCSFNPDIFEIGDLDGSNLDCNGNGQSDYLDIIQGISNDANGDGIPDECQACVPAVIAAGPEPTIGNLGGTATLAVQALGTASFSYQWRKDGTPLSGETNATLAFNNLPLEAAGLYDVIVTNACGQDTSASAELLVDPQPVLTVAQAGAKVVLSWSAADYHLQANPALNSATNWTDIPGTSPVTVPIEAQPRYFRLLQGP